MHTHVPHVEKHFTGSQVLRDVVLGAADGLTVPFALAAGLAGAVGAQNVIVTAGLAEIAAGALAMGLGGYLAAKSEHDHYKSEMKREGWEVDVVPERERAEVKDVFTEYGVQEGEALESVVTQLTADKKRWVDFMMRFELGLEKPDSALLLKSPLTIGFAYLGGGLVPLVPYMVVGDVETALAVSAVVTLFTLFVLGAFKGKFTGLKPWKAGVQTMLVGGVAAGVAYFVAKMFG